MRLKVSMPESFCLLSCIIASLISYVALGNKDRAPTYSCLWRTNTKHRMSRLRSLEGTRPATLVAVKPVPLMGESCKETPECYITAYRNSVEDLSFIDKNMAFQVQKNWYMHNKIMEVHIIIMKTLWWNHTQGKMF